LLATGCADFKCRVISTYSGDVDGESVNAGPFGSPVVFGETYAELSALGWVNAVAWSPSGTSLAFAGHDSSLHVATFSSSSKPVVQSIRFRDLPLNALIFASEASIVGGGHDFNPLLFTREGAGGSWSFVRRLDEKKDDKSAAATSGVSAARQLFQNKTRVGQDAKSEGDTLWTQHDNAITCIGNFSKAPGPVEKISTTGLDGRLVIWDLSSLGVK
jgi:actin related protein 2/3 complex subunit 1A/1B